MIENQKILIEKAYEAGFEAEKAYGGCAQCTLIAVFKTLGIENPSIVKAASGLAGGGGRMCDGVCGGYSGGSLAMSLVFGRRASAMDADNDDKITSMEMTVKLRETFIKEFGSVNCGDIHKKLFGRNYNMWSQIEIDQFNADGAHEQKCTSTVGKAAAAAVKIILEEAEKREMSLEDIRQKTTD
ncbi:MAG: C-GCAxxG-C-C family protein [Spirochaetales bacterium]|nr:C-GCAxxG-C-C family protein [Spirochaetales bacterium]